MVLGLTLAACLSTAALWIPPLLFAVEFTTKKIQWYNHARDLHLKKITFSVPFWGLSLQRAIITAVVATAHILYVYRITWTAELNEYEYAMILMMGFWAFCWASAPRALFVHKMYVAYVITTTIATACNIAAAFVTGFEAANANGSWTVFGLMCGSMLLMVFLELLPAIYLAMYHNTDPVKNLKRSMTMIRGMS